MMEEKGWKTIFVSHPIRPEDAEIEEMKTKARRAVEKAYNSNSHTVFDIDFNDFKELEKDKLYYDFCVLQKVIEIINISDIVYFPEGWENYKICKATYYICDLYKFPHIYVKDGSTIYHLFDKEDTK